MTFITNKQGESKDAFIIKQKYLHEGMELYHKTNRTCSRIVKFDDNNITIKLRKEIASKKILTLPIIMNTRLTCL